MKLSISWGSGIVIAFIIFMTVSLATMFYFMSQDVHLVTDNYYEKELVYQNQIDKMSRTSALDEKVEISFNELTITITFPKSQLVDGINGEAYFYRPSDPKNDFRVPIELNSNGEQILSASMMKRGFWRIKLQWSMNGEEYYSEKAIIIN